MSTLTPILVSIRLIVHEILTKTATNLPADTAAYRVAHRWVRDYQMLTIVYPTCLQNLKPIRLIVYDLQPKPIFQKIVYLTLTFDPMTLTSYQILMNSTRVLSQPIFCKIVYLTLTFKPTTLTFYREIYLINIYSHTKFGECPTKSTRVV